MQRIADLLFDTFEIDEVESEWLDMLELDKEDYHGIIYKLLNLYLLTEQLEKARMTMKTYEGNLDPVFTYGKVLERYLSDDIAGAKRALKKAYDYNPYVYTMLIGGIDPKSDYSEAFRNDDLFDEAYSFLEDEGMAWLDHEDARYWRADQNLPIKRPKVIKK